VGAARGARHGGWDKALTAMASELKCAPACVSASSYVTLAGGKPGTLVSDPLLLSFTLLDEMVQLVQTAHAGSAAGAARRVSRVGGAHRSAAAHAARPAHRRRATALLSPTCST
jgi:hypothetical protein